MGICSGISKKWLFIHCFQIESEFRNVDFWGGRKTGEPGEKPSEQGWEPTTNSTHIWCWVRELNPGHIGGRRALSPLLHPCYPQDNLYRFYQLWQQRYMSSTRDICTLSQKKHWTNSAAFPARDETVVASQLTHQALALRRSESYLTKG